MDLIFIVDAGNAGELDPFNCVHVTTSKETTLYVRTRTHVITVCMSVNNSLPLIIRKRKYISDQCERNGCNKDMTSHRTAQPPQTYRPTDSIFFALFFLFSSLLFWSQIKALYNPIHAILIHLRCRHLGSNCPRCMITTYITNVWPLHELPVLPSSASL